MLDKLTNRQLILIIIVVILLIVLGIFNYLNYDDSNAILNLVVQLISVLTGLSINVGGNDSNES